MENTTQIPFKLTKLHKVIACAGLTCSTLFAGQAMAIGIEEVIVTAQKREQNLQDVPLSVSAISGDRIKELGFGNTQELAANTPGLTWEGTAKSKPSLFLRGVGVADFQTGSRSPVAFYLDGVYQGSTFGISTLLADVERVEVLRGPQGTLWGKNTTAGLLNFVATKAVPGEEVNGYAEVSTGNFGQQKYEAAGGISLSDNAAIRVMIAHQEDDGAYENFGPDFNGDVGGGEADAYRFNFVYEPTEDLSIGFTAHYTETDGEATPSKNLGTKDPGDAANGFRANCPFPDAGTLGTKCVDRDGFENTGDLHEVAENFKSQEDTESSGLALQIDYAFDNFDLTSITAYSESERELHKDNDGGSSILSEANQDDNFDGWSQELRLASSGDGDIQWILGLFYYEDDLDYYRSTVRSSNPEDSSFSNNLAAARIQDIHTETYAVFGEMNFDLSDSWLLTLGLRWTYDERDGIASGFEYMVDPSFPGTEVRVSRDYATSHIDNANFLDEPAEEDWSEFSGKIATQYIISDDLNIWASIARGFKGGDPNSGAFGQPEDFNISDPEYLTSFEVGVKSTLLDGTMQLNASAYYYDYEDKQVFTEIDGGGAVGNLSVLSNAAALTIQGADVELSWSIGENWFIQSSAAYIDSEFDEFLQTVRGRTTDRSGNTTPLTPELSFSLVVRYEHMLPGGGAIYVQGTSIYKDDQFFTNDNNPIVGQEDHWLLGGSLGWRSADETWDISAWGKNLNDEDYTVHGFDLSFRGAVLPSPGDPMKYGVTARYRF